jgi:exodeoxyribonuclease VII large subunit
MISGEAIGLVSLVANVKDALQVGFPAPVWVVAEIMEINLNRSGHCYLELIEKDTLSDKIVAKTRATIWSYAYG